MLKRALLATTTALAIGTFAILPAAAQQNATPTPQQATACQPQLHQFEQTMAHGGDLGRGTQRDLRQLYDAARVFAENGNEQACQMVLGQAQELYEQHQSQQSSESATGAAQQTPDPDSRTYQVAHAQSLGQHAAMLRADTIDGMAVRNPQDQHLGYVSDVIINPQNGQVQYVLVAHGGFLGIGSDWIPVRWQNLRITPNGEIFVLNISEQDLSHAPKVDRQALQSAEAPWRSGVDQFWQQHGG